MRVILVLTFLVLEVHEGCSDEHAATIFRAVKLGYK
jgi:hypothetical protein